MWFIVSGSSPPPFKIAYKEGCLNLVFTGKNAFKSAITLTNGIIKERSLLGHVLLFGCCVTSYHKFLSLRVPMCHWLSGMVGSGAQGYGWKGAFLTKTLGRSHFLVDCNRGSRPLEDAHIPCCRPCHHLQPTETLRIFVFLQNLCLPPALRVHVTRSNPRDKSLLAVPWPEELQILVGSGD